MKALAQFQVVVFILLALSFEPVLGSEGYNFKDIDHVIANYFAETSAAQIKTGAKILEQASPKNEQLLDVAATILEQNYQLNSDYWEDASAWLLRALGSSENMRYSALVENIEASSKSGKIKRYAARALRELRKGGGGSKPFNTYKVNLEQYRTHVASLNPSKEFTPDYIGIVSVGDTLTEVYTKLGNPSSVGIYHFTTRKAFAGTIQLEHLKLNYRGAGDIRFNSVSGEYIVDSIVPTINAVVALPQSNTPKNQNSAESEYTAEILRLADKINSGLYGNQKDAIDELRYSGISDKRVFDPLKSYISEGLKTADTKAQIDQVSWLIKGLAYSGRLEYEPFFVDIVSNSDNKKIARYTSSALDLVRTYSSWNPIISKDLQSAPKGMLDVYRVLNMLRAGDINLQIVGAKIAVKQDVFDETILKFASSRLNQAGFSATEKFEVDLMAWLCRYVGSYAGSDEIALFERLSEEAKSGKVRKYAKRYL